MIHGWVLWCQFGCWQQGYDLWFKTLIVQLGSAGCARPSPLVIWASKLVPVLPYCPTCQEQPQALQIMYSPRVLSMKWRVGVPSPNVAWIRDGLQNAGLNPIPVRIAFSCSIGARSDLTCSSICTPKFNEVHLSRPSASYMLPRHSTGATLSMGHHPISKLGIWMVNIYVIQTLDGLWLQPLAWPTWKLDHIIWSCC